MSGRSLLAASLLLLLALGSAAPGAAQVVEDPHWRQLAADETGGAQQRSAPPDVRTAPGPVPAQQTRAGG